MFTHCKQDELLLLRVWPLSSQPQPTASQTHSAEQPDAAAHPHLTRVTRNVHFYSNVQKTRGRGEHRSVL